jgi:hypothetical protein
MKKDTKKQLIAFFILIVFMGSTVAIAISSAFLPSEPNLDTVYSFKLTIFIYGQKVSLPNNNGDERLGTKEFDKDSLIHVFTDQSYTLGNIFEILKIYFDNECIHNYCTGSDGTMRMYVNDEENFEFANYTVSSGEEVVIDFSRL